MLPMQCFSCSTVLSNKQDTYRQLLFEGATHDAALNAAWVRNPCCRALMMAAAPWVEAVMEYAAARSVRIATPRTVTMPTERQLQSEQRETRTTTTEGAETETAVPEYQRDVAGMWDVDRESDM
jgi:DNA-directed RNA polymerase subunit N (RpoN/RPB10)